MEKYEDGALAIRNVETDVEAGFIRRLSGVDPRDPSRIVTGCQVVNGNLEEIATILNITVPDPLKQAAVAVAACEEHYGYPCLKDAPPQPQADRIERRLGNLAADAVSELARLFIEYLNGAKKVDCRKCGELLAQLFEIAWSSSFQSFNSELHDFEPYFANIPAWGPRLYFADALNVHGLFELQTRFPAMPEQGLQAALSLLFTLFDEVVLKEIMKEVTEEAKKRAMMSPAARRH
jgi:hypothetical protein